jgi:hypothetical protein
MGTLIVVVVGCARGGDERAERVPPAAHVEAGAGSEDVAPRATSVSSAVSKLIAMVPASAESVFCVDTPLTIEQPPPDGAPTPDPSALRMANYLTTRLAACVLGSLKVDVGQVQSAVSACELIRLPVADPNTHICMGAFQSHRCEVLLLSRDLPTDWLASLAKRPHADRITLAGIDVVSFNVEGDGLGPLSDPVLIANPMPNLLCFSNRPELLTSMLELQRKLSSNGTDHSIKSDPIFHLASALVSESRGFWGVRIFGRETVESDPTSVRNPNSVVGVFDQKGAVTAARILDSDSKLVELYYGTDDASAAGRLAKLFRESQNLETQTTSAGPENTRAFPQVVLCVRLKCESKMPGLPSAAVFGTLMAMFAQGFML